MRLQNRQVAFNRHQGSRIYKELHYLWIPVIKISTRFLTTFITLLVIIVGSYQTERKIVSFGMQYGLQDGTFNHAALLVQSSYLSPPLFHSFRIPTVNPTETPTTTPTEIIHKKMEIYPRRSCHDHGGRTSYSYFIPVGDEY